MDVAISQWRYIGAESNAEGVYTMTKLILGKQLFKKDSMSRIINCYLDKKLRIYSDYWPYTYIKISANISNGIIAKFEIVKKLLECDGKMTPTLNRDISNIF